MLRHAVRLTERRGPITCSACSSSNSSQDHYKVLGIEPNANQKDIKAAYYKLSKQHHPDTNPDKKDEAAQLFHQVSMAYEVLGSDEKRKLYDLTRIKTTTRTDFNGYGRQRPQRTKEYTDLDIDYKNFEQFQRSTRRRPQFHSHFDMPNEFYEEFGGGKKRVFKSEYEETTEKFNSMYKDSRAAQREAEELRREVAREQEKLQEKWPIPTFEQMMRDKRQKEKDDQKQYIAGFFVAGLLAAFSALFLIR